MIRHHLSRVVSARAATLATTLVAVVSVATGVSTIVASAQPAGPLAAFVPPAVQSATGFTGTVTGFVLLVAAAGMRRGLRAGWLAAAVLLPAALTQGLLQSTRLSVALVLCAVAAAPSVVVARGQFERGLALTQGQLAAGTAVVAVQLYGTAGAFALREQFASVDTVLDAFYFALVTASTVGYGDVTPEGQAARLFTISVVVLGTASFAVAVGVLLTPIVESRFAEVLGRMTDADLALLEDHVVVLGYGDLTEPILTELSETPTEFVVVTPDREVGSRLGERDLDHVVGDPSDEETLRRVNVDSARAVVAATNDDAQDALAVLTARAIAPDCRVVAAASDTENVAKLRRAGADTVVSPASIGGHLLVRSALGAEGMEDIADWVLGHGETNESPPDADSLDD